MPEDSHAPAAPEETHAETQDDGGHAQGGIMSPDPGLAIWTVITFVILLVILRKIAWGPILETLDKREKAIKESIEGLGGALNAFTAEENTCYFQSSWGGT